MGRPFWGRIYPEKTKLILKTKISAKTTSLGLSNNINLTSQKCHRIFLKVIRKPGFEPKIRLNNSLGSGQSVNRYSHIA